MPRPRKDAVPDPIRFEAVETRPSISIHVIDQIKEFLHSHDYGPGSFIPSERELADQIGVSRNTARSAIHTLAYMGVLDLRHGARTRIAATGASILRAPFEFLLLLLRPSYEQMQFMRETLEIALAGHAALNRTDDDLTDLDAALQTVSSAVGQKEGAGGQVPAANRRFHNTVAQAAHEPLMECVLTCLLEARSAYLREKLPQPQTNWQVTNEIHERIVQAIRDRDALAARQAMAQDMGLSAEIYRYWTAEAEAAAKASESAIEAGPLATIGSASGNGEG